MNINDTRADTTKFTVWFRAWVARHIVSPDPWPEYSRLDRLDGLTNKDTK